MSRSVMLWQLRCGEIFSTVGCFLAVVLHRLTRLYVCALLLSCRCSALGPTLMLLQSSCAFADLSAMAPNNVFLSSQCRLLKLSHSHVSCPGRYRCIRPIESLFRPPSRETLGVLFIWFHRSFGWCPLASAAHGIASPVCPRQSFLEVSCLSSVTDLSRLSSSLIPRCHW